MAGRAVGQGPFARRAASIFGGFRGLASALRDPPTAAVLAAFLADAKHEAPGWFLSADARRYLALEDVRTVLGGDAGELLDDLRGRDAVALGSILKCARFRQAAWYDVDAFGRTFTCSRCRLDQEGNRFSWLGARRSRSGPTGSTKRCGSSSTKTATCPS